MHACWLLHLAVIAAAAAVSVRGSFFCKLKSWLIDPRVTSGESVVFHLVSAKAGLWCLVTPRRVSICKILIQEFGFGGPGLKGCHRLCLTLSAQNLRDFRASFVLYPGAMAPKKKLPKGMLTPMNPWEFIRPRAPPAEVPPSSSSTSPMAPTSTSTLDVAPLPAASLEGPVASSMHPLGDRADRPALRPTRRGSFDLAVAAAESPATRSAALADLERDFYSASSKRLRLCPAHLGHVPRKVVPGWHGASYPFDTPQDPRGRGDVQSWSLQIVCQHAL